MKKFASLVALATLALSPLAAHAAGVAVSEGKMIYGPDAKRVGPVYKVKANGAAVELILDGKVVTIATVDLTEKDGKVVSSKTKAELTK